MHEHTTVLCLTPLIEGAEWSDNRQMLAKRIIPCLDVTGGRVVKGVNFVDLRDAGDPVEIAARYNEQGADEFLYY